jgi:hypothetical protein
MLVPVQRYLYHSLHTALQISKQHFCISNAYGIFQYVSSWIHVPHVPPQEEVMGHEIW